MTCFWILLDLVSNNPMFPSDLSALSLASNHLKGVLPSDLFSKLTQLRHLYLNDNQFSGSIPTEVGLLSSLKKLSLQHNNLSGTLPTELGQIVGMKEMYIGKVDLNGPIPSEMTQMTNLAALGRLKTEGLTCVFSIPVLNFLLTQSLQICLEQA